MPFFDLDAAQLPHYRPDLRIPEDLASFWDATLREAREHPLGLEVRPIAGELTTVDVYDVEFAGFGGHRIKAWYLRPAGHGVVPVVVEYLGYGGGRGLPHEHLRWACAGFGHLVMDTRGQGSAWGGGGGTPDPAGSGPAVPGVMTRGIESPRDHYYRRVYTDGVRAVEAARALPDVDPAAVAVTGVSQGGAITLAVAGLARGLVAAMPDVPFMCQVDRAITLTDSRPYCEVADYLHTHRGEGVEQRVLTTLSYVDAANIATMARVPALFSTALMDTTCPPSTVYAAFNHYGHPDGSRIDTYRFNRHEGGEAYRFVEQVAFLRDLLTPAGTRAGRSAAATRVSGTDQHPA